jgi:hypothetical protein
MSDGGWVYRLISLLVDESRRKIVNIELET